MAMIHMDYPGSQSNAELVEAVTDRIILITRVVITSEGAGSFQLLSDGGGGAETPVTPLLYAAAGQPVDLVLHKQFALAAERGKSLEFTSSIAGEDTNHSVIVWYELVN